MDKFSVDWDLSVLYANEEDVIKDFDKYKELTKSLKQFKGKLTTRAGLLDYLRKSEEQEKLLTKFFGYVFLRKSLNGKDLFSRQIEEQYHNFYSQIAPELSFITPEISKNKSSDLKKWAKEKDFEKYDLDLLDVVENKKHVLPEKTSAILSKNQSFGAFSDVFDNFNDVDLKFGKIKTKDGLVELTLGNYSKFIIDEDPKVRKRAHDMLSKAYANFNYTLGSLYLSDAKETIFFCELEKHKTVLDKVCNSDKTKPSVLATLIETVRENIGLFYRFERLKKKYLNFKKLNSYEIVFPVGQVKDKYTYDDCVKIVLEAMSVMGEDYVSTLKKAVSEGWIDVYEKPAKTSGGFCMGLYGYHPYVLLNYDETFDTVTTLAHELGHAMHNYYTDKTQPITKSESSIFASEVASIVNEIILYQYMIKSSKTKKEKIYYIHELMVLIYGTLYRQTMFSEFEHFVYTSLQEKKPLLVEDLNDKYKELQDFYFGKEAKMSNLSKYEWSRVPHFYRPYYVYKYATGFISACTIAQNIMTGDKEYLKKYKSFLSAGDSVPPLELLKTVDVDLTKKNTLEKAFKLYKSLLEQFEELTKE